MFRRGGEATSGTLGSGEDGKPVYETGDVAGPATDSNAARSPNSERSEAASTVTYSPADEQRLLRKIDTRIIPTIWASYFVSYLDRSSIGNAYTGGMGDELAMTSTQYSVVLLVFFISYVLFEVPSNLLLTRVRPHVYLPALMLAWGGTSLCFAAARTWQAIAGLRVVLGAFEAGFAPGVLFLLSAFYRKAELDRRYALYYTATAVSGVVGGLVAGGLILRLDGVGGLSGWRWLFIVEGAATCLMSVCAYFILPDFPATTRWLTPKERKTASARLAKDSLGDTQTQAGLQISHARATRLAFADWRTWAFSLLYALTTGAQTIQYYVPQLVKSMGYEGFGAQFWTGPVFACAFAAILIFCFSSDLLNERPLHVASACLLALAAFSVLAGVTDSTARYVMLCFAVAAVYAACPLVSVWLSNAIPHPSEKRAVAQATVNAIGNSASIYGSFLFPKDSTDNNRTGFAVNAAFMALALAVAFFLRWALVNWPYPDLEASQPLHEDGRGDGEASQGPAGKA